VATMVPRRPARRRLPPDHFFTFAS
jgi:hypothetical protein